MIVGQVHAAEPGVAHPNLRNSKPEDSHEPPGRRFR